MLGGGFIQWAHVDGNLQRPLEVMAEDNAQREELRRRGEYTPVRSVSTPAPDPSSHFVRVVSSCLFQIGPDIGVG